jgi:prepilin-type N-terminal cleavage/methylation domain-containing protein
MFKKYTRGFSLLELLVVISIIGILVSVGVAAFTTAQAKARDSRRRADIKAMQDAFEQYKGETGLYDDSCSIMAEYDTGSGDLMPGGLPTDPRNTGDYVYSTASGCSDESYCVCAYLESGTGNANAPTGAACNYSAGGSYYCLSSLQ